MRKKEDEARNKERQAEAEAAAQNGGDGHGPGSEEGQAPATYPVGRGPILPPLGYQSSQYPAPPSGSVPQQQLPEYSPSAVYPGYSPSAPNYPPSAPYSQYAQCEFLSQPNGSTVGMVTDLSWNQKK